MSAFSTLEAPPARIRFPHTLEEVRAEKARRSLETFVQESWHAVEPETEYHNNWHIGAICYYLEALSSGEIQHLLINVPPGFMKSLLVSVMFPAWEWIERPQLRYIAASTGMSLATRDTKRSRDLILSEWYRRHYGGSFYLEDDQNQKTRFQNNHKGYRVAKSTGSGTGERGNRVIYDDPHELDDADYPEQLKASVFYNNVTLDSRLSNRETDSKIVVQQRVAVNDVSGDILKKMEAGGKRYEVLCLPMRHDPAYQMVVSARNNLDWEDPRKKGELLDPGRYSGEAVAQDEVTYGDRAPAVLDQNPKESATSIFKREWFSERYDASDASHRNASVARYIFWDTAFREGEHHDYSAYSVWHLSSDYRLKLAEAGQERLAFPDLTQRMEEVAMRHNADGKLRAVVVEDVGAGTSALQTLRQSSGSWLSRYMQPFHPKGKKTERAREASVWARRGSLLLPHPNEAAPWLHDLEEQLFSFPNTQHDDMVDTVTMSALYLRHLLAQGLRFRQGAA